MHVICFVFLVWSNLQVRYTMATETRNNLIAANQNITSAQRYLATIQFPYCKQDEMQTLTRATNNIYTDMQTQERHAHAAECYSVTHKRAAALLQWFDHVSCFFRPQLCPPQKTDLSIMISFTKEAEFCIFQVIQNTINKDLDKASQAVAAKEKQLRAERLKLIKEKIRESQGTDVDLNVENGKANTPRFVVSCFISLLSVALVFLQTQHKDANERTQIKLHRTSDSPAWESFPIPWPVRSSKSFYQALEHQGIPPVCFFRDGVGGGRGRGARDHGSRGGRLGVSGRGAVDGRRQWRTCNEIARHSEAIQTHVYGLFQMSSLCLWVKGMTWNELKAPCASSYV